MQNAVQLVSRILLSLPFVVFGYLQLTNIPTYAANPAVVKFSNFVDGALSPTVIAWMVAGIDLIGGLLLVLGLQARAAAAVLCIFVLLTLYFAHPYWTMDGPARAANQAHFYKNLAVIGGLLLIVSFGAGAYSLDGSFKRKVSRSEF